MQDSPGTGKPRMRSQLLLALGALVGLVLAATGLVDRWSGPGSNPGGGLPGFAVARVGETYIPRSRYVELLSDLETDKRTPLTAADRQFVLGRLIDEELLILRGMELGLPESSPPIRKAIAAAVIAQVATESDAMPPGEDALRQLYESDPEFFAATARYQLRWWRLPLSGDGSGIKARLAAAHLDAPQLDRHVVASEEVERLTGLKRELILPEQMLPLNKVADYLGPDLAQRVVQLDPGHYSAPIEVDGSINILFLVNRQAGALPAFEQLRPVLEAEYTRRAGEQALRDYLAWLRERTPVTLDPEITD